MRMDRDQSSTIRAIPILRSIGVEREVLCVVDGVVGQADVGFSCGVCMRRGGGRAVGHGGIQVFKLSGGRRNPDVPVRFC